MSISSFPVYQIVTDERACVPSDDDRHVVDTNVGLFIYMLVCLHLALLFHPLNPPELSRWQFVEYKTWSHLISQQPWEWKESQQLARTLWNIKTLRKNIQTWGLCAVKLWCKLLKEEIRAGKGFKDMAFFSSFFFLPHICVENCEKKASKTFIVK